MAKHTNALKNFSFVFNSEMILEKSMSERNFSYRRILDSLAALFVFNENLWERGKGGGAKAGGRGRRGGGQEQGQEEEKEDQGEVHRGRGAEQD